MITYVHIRSAIRGIALGALALSLLGGPASAAEYPKTVCDGDTCTFYATSSTPTSTYHKRGNFTVPVIGGNPITVNQNFSLILCNGYGDVYFLNLLRDRTTYQAYRGYVTYRGFSLSGCSTTGEVVLMRIRATSTMPEHFSLMSTSVRWGTTLYVLNDVFRYLNATTMAGYENWYPFDMSCSVAMYVSQGGWQ